MKKRTKGKDARAPKRKSPAKAKAAKAKRPAAKAPSKGHRTPADAPTTGWKPGDDLKVGAVYTVYGAPARLESIRESDGMLRFANPETGIFRLCVEAEFVAEAVAPWRPPLHTAEVHLKLLDAKVTAEAEIYATTFPSGRRFRLVPLDTPAPEIPQPGDPHPLAVELKRDPLPLPPPVDAARESLHSHTCPACACCKHPGKPFCEDHWDRLPAEIQQALVRSDAAYLAALHDAFEHLGVSEFHPAAEPASKAV